MNRIPLANNLWVRGVTGISKQCKLCLKEDESVEHVFFRCDYALTVWNWLANWSRLLDIAPIDFNSFMVSAISIYSEEKRFKLLLSLGYSVLWLLWKEKNERFFWQKD